MKAAKHEASVPGAGGHQLGPWVAGLLLLAAVATMYVLYHQRNWSLLDRVVDMIRIWWYQFRIAIGAR